MKTHEAHLAWDELNDLVDGRLPDDDRARVDRHLLACTECEARYAELTHLLAQAHAAPDAVTPPDELWDDIRTTLAKSHGGGALVTRVRGGEGIVARIAPAAPTRGVPSARWLVAAAAALVIVSSGVTALWMRAGDVGRGAIAASESTGREANTTPPPVASSAALPASLARAEAAYLSDAESLRALFDRERQSLSPATIAVVERSLTTIDAAIAEARAALLADPSNTELARFLDSSYRQKVELLRRVTKLEVRT